MTTVIEGVPVRRAHAARSKHAKSERTRQRLCDATLAMIERKPLRQIRVSDISAMAEVSTSAFYLYFADVEAAVLALLADLAATMPDLPAHVGAISRAHLDRDVRVWLDAYLAFWDANYALLRVRNLAADEGEPRFREMRGRMLGPTLDALAAKLTELRGGDAPAISLAAVMMGSMERLASLVRTPPVIDELSAGNLVAAEVLLLCEILRGPHRE